MNGTDVELRKELWMWRGVSIIILLIVLISNIVTFVLDRDQHSRDNQERAAAWQFLKDRTEANGRMIKALNNDLHRCAECHVHPNLYPEENNK